MKRLTGLLLIIGLVLAFSRPTPAFGFQTDKAAAATQAPGKQPEATARQTPAPPVPPALAAGNADRPMTPAEADAAVDKLRQAIHDSMRNGNGSMRQMDPEAQRQIAESADKFMSDPAVREALARQIRDFRMPWQQTPTFWLTGLLVPVAFFAFCGVFFWLRFRQRQEQVQAQMQMQTQLLSKFSSGAELAAFLGSPAGIQMVQGLGSARVNVHRRVITHFSLGAALALLGIGFLFTQHDHGDAAFVFLAIGIGFLISAWLSSRLNQSGSNVSTPPGLPPTLPPQQ